MEIYFLDVGQGTSQLILLGEQRAIAIDAGPSSGDVLLRALTRYGIRRLELFATTHSHSDHLAAAETVIASFTDEIGSLWFLDDPGLRKSRFYARIRELCEGGELSHRQLHRIERDEFPRVVYEDRANSIRLIILSPDFDTNLAAIDANDPNKTAAVFVLEIGSSRIVLASDSCLQQWQRIEAERGKPLKCDIVAVPHHAGNIGQSDDSDFQWLYSRAINTKYAIVSVGTQNTFGHPKGAVINALRENDATVICTQITDQCCADIESVRHGLLAPLEPIRRSVPIKKNRGKSRDVACAGTIVALVSGGSVTINGLATHQRSVDNLAALGRPPLCRACGARP